MVHQTPQYVDNDVGNRLFDYIRLFERRLALFVSVNIPGSVDALIQRHFSFGMDKWIEVSTPSLFGNRLLYNKRSPKWCEFESELISIPQDVEKNVEKDVLILAHMTVYLDRRGSRKY